MLVLFPKNPLHWSSRESSRGLPIVKGIVLPHTIPFTIGSYTMIVLMKSVEFDEDEMI
ncbi:MAG TPA: hypothetical protein VLE95_00320 [Chlamydiales bacterium]|nr:hypothetical protein [Chlamydiales bacterium]